ncbi:MAG: hypothetical protein E7029_11905, partial [Planctomycetaceae bacterium]|nr:hypothetical protein [Planctomycetaceae bacterium]
MKIMSDDALNSGIQNSAENPSSFGNTESLRLETLVSGQILREKFRLERAVGRGEMGLVWKAMDLEANAWRALLFFPDEIRMLPGEAFEPMRREIAKVQKLDHPFICPVHALEWVESLGHFLVLEWLDGMTLEEMLIARSRAYAPMEPAAILDILRRTAEALDRAHAWDLNHRNLTPASIFLRMKDGVPSEAVLLHCGFAAEFLELMDRFAKTSSRPEVKFAYLAPEQWKGWKQNALTDQYALGVIAYEMLAGRLPFRSGNLELLRLCVLQDAPQKIEGFSDRVNAALQKAMGKELHDRFVSCSAFIRELDLLAPEPQTVSGAESEGISGISAQNAGLENAGRENAGRENAGRENAGLENGGTDPLAFLDLSAAGTAREAGASKIGKNAERKPETDFTLPASDRDTLSASALEEPFAGFSENQSDSSIDLGGSSEFLNFQVEKKKTGNSSVLKKRVSARANAAPEVSFDALLAPQKPKAKWSNTLPPDVTPISVNEAPKSTSAVSETASDASSSSIFAPSSSSVNFPVPPVQDPGASGVNFAPPTVPGPSSSSVNFPVPPVQDPGASGVNFASPTVPGPSSSSVNFPVPPVQDPGASGVNFAPPTVPGPSSSSVNFPVPP